MASSKQSIRIKYTWLFYLKLGAGVGAKGSGKKYFAENVKAFSISFVSFYIGHTKLNYWWPTRILAIVASPVEDVYLIILTKEYDDGDGGELLDQKKNHILRKKIL